MRRDVVQIAERVAEPEGHEAIEETDAVIDRRLRQPALIAKIGHILRSKAIERRWPHLLRRRPLGDAGLDERIDEAFQAVLLLIVLVRVHRRERRSADLRQRLPNQLSIMQPASGDHPAKQSRRAVVSAHRRGRIALIVQKFQELQAILIEPVHRRRSCVRLPLRHDRPLCWMERKTYRHTPAPRNPRRGNLWETPDYADVVRHQSLREKSFEPLRGIIRRSA